MREIVLCPFVCFCAEVSSEVGGIDEAECCVDEFVVALGCDEESCSSVLDVDGVFFCAETGGDDGFCGCHCFEHDGASGEADEDVE